jgi:hypothetical protein
LAFTGAVSNTHGLPFLCLELKHRGIVKRLVMMTAAGMPRFSNSMVSCTLYNV